MKNNLYELLSKIKNEWTLIKCLSKKPFGFIGYELTVYKKPHGDSGIKKELRAKTLNKLCEIIEAEICSNGKKVKK